MILIPFSAESLLNRCKHCGSRDSKLLQMLSGLECCTDCVWDFLTELNTRKWLDSRAALARASEFREPFGPKASRPPTVIRHNPSSGLTRQLGTSKRLMVGDSDALGKTGSRIQPELARSFWQHQPEDNKQVNKAKWKLAIDNLAHPSYNSLCLLCGHIFYGAALSKCSRCGGRCVQRSDRDLGLMGRHGQRLVEYAK